MPDPAPDDVFAPTAVDALVARPPTSRRLRNAAERYAVAVAIAGLAIGIRWPLLPVLGRDVPYLTFFPAVAAAAIACGIGPAIVTALLSAAAVTYFLLDPPGSFEIQTARQITGLVLFLAVDAVLIVLAERARRATARAAATAAAARAAMDRITDGIAVFDREWRYAYVNEAACRLSGRPPEHLIGRVLWEAFPELAGTDHERHLRRAMAEQVPARYVSYYPDRGVWVEGRAYPSAAGLTLYARDATAEQLAERRRVALSAAADAVGPTAAPAEALAALNRAAADALGVPRVIVGDVDPSGEFIAPLDDHNAGLPPVTGRHRLHDFGAPQVADLRAGRTVAIADVDADPRVGPAAAARYAGHGCRAFVNVPLVRDGRLVAVFGVHAERPRAWASADVQLAQDLAARAWAVVEAARAARAVHDSEQRVRDSEARLRLAAAAGNVGVWDWDVATNRIEWTDQVYAIHGMEPGTFSGRLDDLFPLYHPDDRDTVRASIGRAVADREAYAIEFRIVRPGGEVRWVMANGRAEYGPDGAPARMRGVVIDVTDRRAAEEARRASEQRYRALVEASPLSVQVLDRAGRTLAHNRAFAELWGVTKADLDAMGYRILNDPELERRGLIPLVRRAFAGETVNLPAVPYDRTHVNAAGGVRWVEAVAYPLKDEAGDVEQVVIVQADVTARMEAQAALATSTERLELAQRAAHIGVYDWDVPNGRLVWNDEEQRIFGLDPGAFGGRIEEWSASLLPEDRERMQAELAAAMARRQADMDFAFRIRRRGDGQVRWIEGSGRFMYDQAGRPLRMVGVNLDATDRRRAEDELRLQSRVLESMTEGVSLSDESGVIVYTNPAEDRMFGYAPGELLGMHVTVQNAYPPEENARVVADVIETLQRTGTWAGEWRNRRKDGTEFYTRAHISALERDGQRYWVCVQRDVTEQRAAAAALAASEERLRLALAASRLGDWAWDARTDALQLGPRTRELLGVAADAPLTFAAFLDVVHPGDREQVRAAADAAVGGRADYDVEHRCVWPDGSVRWVAVRGRAFYDDRTGEPLRMVGVAQDVTDRKTDEQRRAALLAAERSAREQAEHAVRMKDEFLATLSHELRTPLNAILGWSQLIRAGALADAEMRQAIEVVERNARVQAQLVEDLLDMSRIVSGKLRLDVRPTDLTAVVEAAVETVRPAAEAKEIRVACQLDPAAGNVSGDASRLQQVAWNLLSNAIKFTPKGGQVQVVLRRAASHVELVVSDTGQGIAADFLPHVFDRFRQADATTTRRHGGLGLGLAIVKNLVELHGGTVTATSEGDGRGATFTVRLPVTAVRNEAGDDDGGTARANGDPGAVGEPPTAGDTTAGLLRGVTVLAIDDDADARELVRRVLEGCGARVVVVASAAEGLASAAARRPDVIVCDIGMPLEDGYDFIRALRARPAAAGGRTPAVALTAFARPEDRTRAVFAGFAVHLAKPVDGRELIAHVAGLAGRTGAAAGGE